MTPSLRKEKTDITVAEKIDDKNRDHLVGSDLDEEHLSVLDFGITVLLRRTPAILPGSPAEESTVCDGDIRTNYTRVS